jgi:hypothetical protein
VASIPCFGSGPASLHSEIRSKAHWYPPRDSGNICHMLRLFGVGMAFCACASTVVSGAAARSAATADMDISFITVDFPAQLHAGTALTLRVGVGNAGPDASHYRVQVVLPAGVNLVSGGSLECAGTSELVCSGEDAPAGYNVDGSASVIAAAPGTYRFVARLTELSASDPNLLNNEVSLTVNMVERAHVLVARGLAVRPAKPVAGSRFTVSFRVLDQTAGRGIVPAAARCRASPGRARARVLGGRATCIVATPINAQGRIVRGVVTAIVGAQRLPKRFSVRLR